MPNETSRGERERLRSWRAPLSEDVIQRLCNDADALEAAERRAEEAERARDKLMLANDINCDAAREGMDLAERLQAERNTAREERDEALRREGELREGINGLAGEICFGDIVSGSWFARQLRSILDSTKREESREPPKRMVPRYPEDT